jgi:hypothetical protein
VDARLYADDAGRRLRQVAGDLLVLVAAWLAVRTAGRIAGGVRELATVADGLDRSGRTVTAAADRAGEVAEGIPVVGGALATPFRSLGGAGDELTAAGDQVAGTVETLAFWLPTVLVVAVAGWVLLYYLPRRIRWVHEATEVSRLLAGAGADGAADTVQLLGTRAAVTRPLRTLRRHLADPAAALTEGRYRELAVVELRALGLSPDRLEPATPVTR